MARQSNLEEAAEAADDLPDPREIVDKDEEVPLEEVFDDFPVWEVRKRVALQRAFSAGTSIFDYEEAVDMESVFLEIATELDRQFGYAEVTA